MSLIFEFIYFQKKEQEVEKLEEEMKLLAVTTAKGTKTPVQPKDNG